MRIGEILDGIQDRWYIQKNTKRKVSMVINEFEGTIKYYFDDNGQEITGIQLLILTHPPIED